MGEGRFHAADEENLELETEPSERTPERIKIKKELNIIVPKGFGLDKDKFKDALERIIKGKPKSINDLRVRGIDYTGKREYPTPVFIRMREVVGTESDLGWSGLVVGFGDKVAAVRRVQTFDEVFVHAQKILKMEREERNELVRDLELVGHGREFFVDSDGRHRILTLKVLEALGCDVTLSGFKVWVLS